MDQLLGTQNYLLLWSGCSDLDYIRLNSIAGAVVLLPQIVPTLRNNAARRPLTLKYRDPYSWDLPTMHQMLSAFFNASGTTSLPPLEEYIRLPDKASPLYSAHHVTDACNS